MAPKQNVTQTPLFNNDNNSAFRAPSDIADKGEGKPQTLTDKLQSTLETGKEQVSSTINSTTKALNPEEDKKEENKSSLLYGKIDTSNYGAEKEELRSTINSGMESLGLKEEEKTSPTLMQRLTQPLHAHEGEKKAFTDGTVKEKVTVPIDSGMNTMYVTDEKEKAAPSLIQRLTQPLHPHKSEMGKNPSTGMSSTLGSSNDSEKEKVTVGIDSGMNTMYVKDEKKTPPTLMERITQPLHPHKSETGEKPTPMTEKLESTFESGKDKVNSSIDSGAEALGLKKEEEKKAPPTLVQRLTEPFQPTNEEKPSMMKFST